MPSFSNRHSGFLVAGILLTCFTASGGPPGTHVTLGTATNAASFVVTGGGATAAPAFQVGNAIGITSDGFNTGTFATGGSLVDFNGFWYADEAFTIPASATGVSITFSGLGGDDRVDFQINGTNIGSVGGFTTSGLGEFAFPPGPPDVAFTLNGITSGTITTGLNIGASNTLRLIVNNTGGGGAFASTATFANPGDGSSAFLIATLNYTLPTPTPTPLPASLWFAIAGIGFLVALYAFSGAAGGRRRDLTGLLRSILRGRA